MVSLSGSLPVARIRVLVCQVIGQGGDSVAGCEAGRPICRTGSDLDGSNEMSQGTQCLHSMPVPYLLQSLDHPSL